MKKILLIILTVLLYPGYFYLYGQDFQFKGSFTNYDFDSEQAVLNKIEADTDPKTEKVILDGIALKFEYIDYSLIYYVDKYKVIPVYFSGQKGDRYVFDYYVDIDKVVKIVLVMKKGEIINKQVYPEKKDTDPKKK
jgi:hypothetical protein